MFCKKSCLIAGSFIVASIFVCLRVDKQALNQPLMELLDDENKQRYRMIANERKAIYFKGFALGFILSLLALYILNNNKFKASMKHTIYLFFLVILIFCCSSKEQKTLASNLDLVENVNTINDSILYNIQKRIDSELVNSFVDNKSSNLDSIHSKLLLIKSPISNYWQGYVLYNKALFFYGKKDEDIVKNLLEEAIEVIESSPKSSESYALLGTVQSFKIQFMSGMKAGIMSDKAKENFEKALELDGKNLRSFLGLGSLDFYTPVEYGGKLY